MNPKCIQAVNAAAGKPVSAGKLKAIEKELVKKSRELARIDASLPPNQRKWASMSRDERTIAAAEAAMKDMIAEAARKEANAFKQILATNRIEQFVTQRMAEKNTTRSRGFIKFLDLVDAQVGAVRDQYFGQLSDLLEAVTIRDGVGLARNLGMRLFDLDNPGMTKDVVKEIWKNADGHTGNAAAKKAAEAWLKTIEDMRVRFNSAGGNVGKLGYGYLTQIHDSSKIRAAQPQKWGDFVMDRLDRSQYLREDGSRMDDAEVRAIVDQSYETLKNDGFDPDKAGAFRGTGAKANAGSESRVLHFKDGEAWMEYMAEFGRGSLYDAMMGHVSGMARNIALVEAMGPNPAQAARVQFDLGSKDKEAGIGMGGREWFTTPEQRWKIISGESGMPDNEKLANIGSGLRLVQTGALLGSAVMSSITDLGTIRAGIHYNKLPYMQFFANWRKTLWEEAKGIAGGRKYLHQELQTHGIIVDSLIDGLNRWVGDNMVGSAPGRAAGAVMKLSLMNAWTDSLRRAYRMTLENASAELVKKDWEKLTEWDRNRFSELGVTKEDWAVLSKVTPEKIGGRDYITADAVMRTGEPGAVEAAKRWAAAMASESDFGVINPDVASRALVTWGGEKAGTPKGELARMSTQFLSFPTAMITRHWGRVFDTPQGLEGAPMGYRGAEFAQKAGLSQGQAEYLAKFGSLTAFSLSLALLGGIAMQIKALAAGKDPMDMNPENDEGARFWLRAMAQGGGLSYFGNLIFAPQESLPGGVMEKTMGVMAGPVGGMVGGMGDLTIGNLQQLAAGEETDAAAELLRWTNRNLPGQSLWQIRTLWQRNVIEQGQESVNPGFLARMKRRAQKDGTSWWWEPGDRLPERAPDPSAAFEQ